MESWSQKRNPHRCLFSLAKTTSNIEWLPSPKHPRPARPRRAKAVSPNRCQRLVGCLVCQLVRLSQVANGTGIGNALQPAESLSPTFQHPISCSRVAGDRRTEAVTHSGSLSHG